ncbi:pyruvate dehydrogenase E2 component (dihydrolipoamide acetyltransferase) [Saccharopolyspora erythraea NRRL 2338]|uniref:Dihydrolipoamide acetyltransferase component of pyruvate dehydrogenase complex n=2 Tax=Saccharopolyspora erythraea TaxID=1836 RepID=A4FGQ0_SACEN|nr:dihydrolipoamide acetyltransferase family protein [Saccharopolyspora erythraea]PFG96929.1 pyruvate dehydrogenase E2 component (dihydrolipoamide acetyltransferase) [Saccharopolyspora erythraea NRRL 2338]QRK87155.1 2-oxo acid dehydrogenase subunit E2 [Saccharopolyspora erythraea]CAM03225.1 putative dihydrolipoamide acyltransferase component E2 [Saccharopolyspora erythraea NRRL 2338]
MPEFALPDLGEGLTEAEIVNWLVAEGDQVRVDQPVVEVETAKAVVEVPCPYAGVVGRLHGSAGETLTVGSPLLTVEEPGAGFTEPGVVVPDPAPAEEDSGNVLIGYGTSAAPARRNRRRRRTASGAPVAAPVPAPAEPARGARSIAVISPLVRQLARENGIDLTRISGSGPQGVIRRCDVDEAIAAQRAQAQTPTTTWETRAVHQDQPAAERETHAAPAGTPVAPEDSTRIPLRGLRRAVADKLTRSRREIPEATVWVDVDATGLLEARAALNARSPEQPVSVLALVSRFAVLGLRRFPELNSRVEQDEIVLLDRIHLGFAAQTDRGLVVPVVRDAQSMSTRELSDAMRTHTIAGREGSLAPSDLTGGTFTVNNYGVFGVDGSAAIINQPEAAILGVGRIIDRPWAVDGRLAVRKVCELTLAFDHRVCDGGTAGGFLRFVADCVESPITALGEL